MRHALLSSVFVMSSFVACTTSGGNSSNTPPASSPSSVQQPLAVDAPTVSQVLAQSDGTVTSATGLYFGWKGPCRGAPPTRSAWQLVESAQPGAPCVYVDGPAVAGENPANPSGSVFVVVHGTVKTEGGTRYIEASRVERK